MKERLNAACYFKHGRAALVRDRGPRRYMIFVQVGVCAVVSVKSEVPRGFARANSAFTMLCSVRTVLAL